MENNLNETEIQITQDSPVDISLHNESEQNISITQEASVIRGVDGFSPIAKVIQESDGARITITDLNGTTTAFARNGEKGERGDRGERGVQGIPGTNGQDGFSPIATVTKSGDTATISITDKDGTTTASISDGTDGTNGTNGQDGFSPIATVTQSGGITTISITDKNGTTSESITIPTKTSQLTNDGANNTSTYVETSSLATVATTGSYPDLHNKPTIGNGTISIQKNSILVDSFTLNQSGNKTIDISVPTKTSDLTNDGANGTSSFVEASSLATVATTGAYSDLTGTPTIPSLIASSIISSIHAYSNSLSIESSSTAYQLGNIIILNIGMNVTTAFSAQWGYLLKDLPHYSGTGVQYASLLNATNGTVYRAYITNTGYLQVRDAIPTGLYYINLTYVTSV